MTLPEGVLLAARIVTGGAFVLIGLRNIGNRGLIAGMIGTNGFPAPKLLTTAGIGMQIGFGALMVSGFYPLVAAAGLLVFTVVATLMAHSFWTVRDPVLRKGEIGSFLANMLMVGGLIALAAAGWPREAPAEAAAAPVAKSAPLAMPLTIDEVMVGTVDFAADGIWRPAALVMSDTKLSEQEWLLVEQDANMLIASATLITTLGTGLDDPKWIEAADWRAWSKQMQDAAIKARDAARERNTFELANAADELVKMCGECHTKYRPDIPRGPARFPYYPKREGVPD